MERTRRFKMLALLLPTISWDFHSNLFTLYCYVFSDFLGHFLFLISSSADLKLSESDLRLPHARGNCFQRPLKMTISREKSELKPGQTGNAQTYAHAHTYTGSQHMLRDVSEKNRQEGGGAAFL